MTYRDFATAKNYFYTYVFLTIYADLIDNEQIKIRSLELAQTAYEEYHKIIPDEDIEVFNTKAKMIRKEFLNEGMII